ncbi:mitochondrial import inner membrane translocase subunit TIM13 [Cryptococcus wingfieldii CBS 7118]|uniref:Mitochondrial import inner membrane translocase subunit n=2 Tax=Cryptococcus TaxID=5206 RepID=A0A1E3K7G5_9TREE|nr:mitochondrial import inner membrane translocase subunit TIM13 [Cryptococcus wingfieldii CBS 7118]ODO08477.1 mitochondrial import inner membrane translocase subunit TIM13 [Cryptococcus wingfieldii CBS 7118]TYJ54623.1 mitochondrial import inner membrane translocase subunit TIM13 [Cryptococcus floricola]
MSSFFGSGAAGTADMANRKEQMKQSIQQELAIANAQQLINKINENCFAKCVTKPSTELTGSQETCLSQCMGLYMAAFDQVSRSYVQRISKERGGLPGL